MRRAGKIALGILAALLVVILAAFGLIQTSFGKREVVAQLETQLSAAPARLQAQSIEGFVPFDFTLVGASLSDQHGPWLRAGRLHLRWSPSALLHKTLSIDALDSDHLEVLRVPISPTSPPQPQSADNAFTLPSLPVDIVVNRLAIDRLDLGPSFLGEAASFNLQAHAKLGDPANGLQASLRLNRTDRDSDRVSLDLDYRPAADRLDLNAAAIEPGGGLITKSLGLPGTPRFALALQGSGPLVDWHATGHAELDDRPLLTLSASSNGPTTDRKVAFDLRLAELPMLPSNLSGIIEGGIAAQGSVHIAGTDGPITIESLKLDTRPGTITANGTVDPNAGKLHLNLAVSLKDSTPFAAILPPELHWDGVDAKLHLGGTFTEPRVMLNGAVTGLAYGGNQVGEALIDADTALRIDTMQANNAKLSVSAQSITLADPKLQPLLNEGATLDFAGSLDSSGAINADQFDLHAGTLSLNAKGTTEAWGLQAAHITGHLSADDLASLSGLAGLNAKGKAGIDLTVDKQGDALTAQANATTAGLALGIPLADRVLGSAPTLTAAVKRDADGAITIDAGALQAAAAKLTVSGGMAADRTLALKAEGALSDLSRVAPDVSGGVQFAAAISGSADDPAVKLQVSSANLRTGQIAVSALQSSIDATGLLSAPRAAIKLTAGINGEPASIVVDARSDSSFKRATLSGIAVRLGSTAITGKLDLAPPTASGDLALSSPDLGVLAPFIGQKTVGAVNGTIALYNPGGRQNVTLKLNGKAIGIPNVSVATLALTANATDVLRDDPGLDAALTATNVQASGQVLDRVDLKATGHRANLAVMADASGPRGSLAANASIRNHGSDTEIGLAKLDLAFGAVKANLLHPAQIALHGSETKVSGFALASRGGSATLDADLSADANAITLQLSKLPASVLEAAAPDLHILGTLDGKLALSGPKSTPNATFDLRGTSLGVQGASQQLANVKLDGTWQAGQLAATGRVDLTKTSGLDLKLRLPMVAAPATGFPVFDTNATLDATAVGKIDLGLANAFIPGGADHVAGLASLDLSAKGALARPVLAGKVDISDGAYENQRYGTRFQNVTAEIDGNGSKLSIVSLSGATPGGGTMSGNGDIDFSGTMPVGINVSLTNARMIDAPIGTAIVGGSLRMKGTLTEHVDLVGTVGIMRAEITIPDRFPPDIEEIAVVDVNGSPAHAALPAIAADADQPPPKSLQIGLDIAVKAPGQVFVRGRGLDAEVGGDLHIQGTADQPFIVGALKLRQGDFNLLSRDLQFQTGTITFSGGKEIDPLLDFTATTKITAADVTVTVGGTATHPSIAVQSSPELPQDELLAQLLFGKASGSLSPFEAIQLAQATAELSGVSAGSGTLDKLRKTLGLDRLDVGSDASSGGPTLSAGRYVSRRVYVGAKQGTKPGSSAATVEIELTPNVKLNTDVGADSSGKAGVTMEWNY